MLESQEGQWGPLPFSIFSLVVRYPVLCPSLSSHHKTPPLAAPFQANSPNILPAFCVPLPYSRHEIGSGGGGRIRLVFAAPGSLG